jgi:hypothetical protein
MRPAALAFLIALAASAAAWALAVLPLHGKAAAMAALLAAEDVGGRAAAAADPAPTAAEARRLEEALAALRPSAPAPAPRGMTEDGQGSYSGLIPWEDVQGLLAWAAEQHWPVLEVEVRSVSRDPARAACRVVLGQ